MSKEKAIGTETTEDVYSLVKRSIVFIYPSGCNPCVSINQPMPLGTGFFVGLALENEEFAKDKSVGTKIFSGSNFRYLVTNKHVITDLKSVVIRLNNAANTKYISFDIPLVRGGDQKNVFPHKESDVDLVAILCPEFKDHNSLILDHSMILGDKELKSLEITEGTEVFTGGMFLNYQGLEKNFPMIRTGRISLLTEEKWCGGFGYLAELGTTVGASGSPVFLQPSQIKVDPKVGMMHRWIGPKVIGVVKAMPNLPAQVVAPNGFPIGTAKVSQGLAVIEPGKFLKELIDEQAQFHIKCGHKLHGF